MCEASSRQGGVLDTKGYPGYSFRIRAATTAALAGTEGSIIKKTGRWKTTAYQRYISTVRDSLAAI